MLESLGGQTVTTGKSRSSMGWVVIEVAMGFSCHALYDLLMRIPAVIKPRQTTKAQTCFPVLVWKKNYAKNSTKTYLCCRYIDEAVYSRWFKELSHDIHCNFNLAGQWSYESLLGQNKPELDCVNYVKGCWNLPLPRCPCWFSFQSTVSCFTHNLCVCLSTHNLW